MLEGARLAMTGITGQVGTSIAALLAPHNEILGLARFTRPGSREEVAAMGVTPIACDYAAGDFTGVPDDVDYVLHVGAAVYPEDFDVGVRENAEGTGLLFQHFRRAKAWIALSTTGVYWDHPDPWYRYKETDRLGGSWRISSRFAYGPTKFAGEAVARTLSRLHGVPVTIPRLNWAYGRGGHGGLPVRIMANVLAGRAVTINPDWEMVGGPIHEDDLAEHVEGFLAAASVGGTIVNWAGDDAISVEQMVPWLGELFGVEHHFEHSREATAYPRATDNAKRVELVGACAVPWQEGFRRVAAHHFPDAPQKAPQ